jgi:hypothetical protein
MKLRAYFQLKSRKKPCCTFVKFLTKFKTKNCCKTAKYVLSKWTAITSTDFVLAHAHNVENSPWHKQNGGQLCTPLCFHIPGLISRAELVPSHGASRRRLGDKYCKISLVHSYNGKICDMPMVMSKLNVIAPMKLRHTEHSFRPWSDWHRSLPAYINFYTTSFCDVRKCEPNDRTTNKLRFALVKAHRSRGDLARVKTVNVVKNRWLPSLRSTQLYTKTIKVVTDNSQMYNNMMLNE